jgi:hypothetical protein
MRENMATMPLELTDEEIARRAYEISESEDRGTDEENWFRAEQELRARSSGAPKRRRPTTAKAAASAKPTRPRKPKSTDEKPGKSEK